MKNIQAKLIFSILFAVLANGAWAGGQWYYSGVLEYDSDHFGSGYASMVWYQQNVNTNNCYANKGETIFPGAKTDLDYNDHIVSICAGPINCYNFSTKPFCKMNVYSWYVVPWSGPARLPLPRSGLL